jgi:hypothetical protein
MALATNWLRCALRACSPRLQAALPWLACIASIRSWRDASLISLLLQMVRAKSDRMAREACITLANRAANSDRLEEISVPGDFMNGCSSEYVRKTSIEQCTQPPSKRRIAEASRWAGPRQRRTRGSRVGCNSDWPRAGIARRGLFRRLPRTAGTNVAADLLLIQFQDLRGLSSCAQNRRKCASSPGNRQPDEYVPGTS